MNKASQRTCISHTDLLHGYFQARNFSALIFPLTYLPVLVFLITHVRQIRILNFFMLTYSLIVLTRMFCIWVLPLCEPTGAIPLDDYLLNGLFYPNGYSAVDLFYSGHVATLFLLVLMLRGKWKYIVLALATILAILVIWQKVHYTIDVMAAPALTWLCYQAAKKIYYLTSTEKYTAR